MPYIYNSIPLGRSTYYGLGQRQRNIKSPALLQPIVCTLTPGLRCEKAYYTLWQGTGTGTRFTFNNLTRSVGYGPLPLAAGQS